MLVILLGREDVVDPSEGEAKGNNGIWLAVHPFKDLRAPPPSLKLGLSLH